MKKTLFFAGLSLLSLFSCMKSTKHQAGQIDPVQKGIETATQQIGRQVEIIEDSGKFLNPRTVYNGVIEYIPADDWTSGFFPGTMWYMYELTNDNKWKDLGIKYTETLDSIKYLKWHHDVGFMIYCSYGNAYRLTGNPAYKDVIIETAKSLSSRFRPVAGVIQSWDEDRGWQGTRGCYN